MKFGGVTRSGCGENLNVEVRDKAWLFPNGCQAAAHDHTSSIKLDRVGWEKIRNSRPFGGKHAHEDHEGLLCLLKNEEFISVLRVQTWSKCYSNRPGFSVLGSFLR